MELELVNLHLEEFDFELARRLNFQDSVKDLEMLLEMDFVVEEGDSVLLDCSLEGLELLLMVKLNEQVMLRMMVKQLSPRKLEMLQAFVLSPAKNAPPKKALEAPPSPPNKTTCFLAARFCWILPAPNNQHQQEGVQLKGVQTSFFRKQIQVAVTLSDFSFKISQRRRGLGTAEPLPPPGIQEDQSGWRNPEDRTKITLSKKKTNKMPLVVCAEVCKCKRVGVSDCTDSRKYKLVCTQIDMRVSTYLHLH